MPERWARELNKLRDVEPDGDRTWQRAQRPPRGEGMPPRRQRVVAGVVAFAVFAVAGIFAWQILRPTSRLDTSVGLPQGATVMVTFRIADMNAHGAHARLTVDGATVQGTVGSHCWTFSGGSGCADTVAPSFADGDFVPVPRGALLAITGDATSVDGELDRAGDFPFPKVQGFGSITEPVALDQPPGRYVLSFVAHADDGDVPFYFPIELVKGPGGASGSVGSPSGDTLAVSCTDQGATVSPNEIAGSPEGVRIHATDATGRAADVIVSDPSQPPLAWRLSAEGGSAFDPLTVVQAPSGDLTVTCVGPDDAPLGSSASFTVTDPAHWFHPWTLDCPIEEIKTTGAMPAVISDGEIRSTARQFLDGLLPDDVAGQSGWSAQLAVYPEMISFERAGRRIAWLEIGAAGRWFVALASATCAGAGLSPSVTTPTSMLGCSPGDERAFSHQGPSLLPAGEAFIRANVAGILPSDAVDQLDAVTGVLKPRSGPWVIERDGTVVAWVDYETLSGVACRGSGIEGV